MEEQNALKEKTKSYMKEYLEKYGIGGLLGIVIELDGEKVDKQDVEKHRTSVEIERQAKLVTPPYFEDITTPSMISQRRIEPASIYAREHIEAVQQDLLGTPLEQNLAPVVEQPKVKVLENKAIPSAPVEASPIAVNNPWSDAKTVFPGEINNILIKK